MSASSRHATRAAGIQDPPWEPLVSSAERQTPPGSDPAPAVIVVILLPRQGRAEGGGTGVAAASVGGSVESGAEWAHRDD